jgi:hypothetical protein
LPVTCIQWHWTLRSHGSCNGKFASLTRAELVDREEGVKPRWTGRKLRQKKERKGIGQRLNGNDLRLQTEEKGNKIDK